MNWTSDDPILLNPVKTAPGTVEGGRLIHADAGFTDRRPIDLFDSSAGEGTSLVDYAHVLLRRKWVVAGVFTVAVAAAAVYAMTRVPLYRSSAAIEVEKVYPVSSNMNEFFSFFGQYDLYYQTQIESLKSRSVAAAFLKRFNESERARAVVPGTLPATNAAPAGGDERIGGGDRARESKEAGAVEDVLARISVSPVKTTQLIQVTLDANDPYMARDMLQEYLAAFLDETRSKRTEIAERMRTWLKHELLEAKKQVEASETELLEFAKKHDIVSLDKGTQQSLGVFERAADSLLQSKSNRLNLEIAEQSKQRILPAQVNNEYLQSLKSQLASLKSEYMGMSSVYSPEYFKMTLMRNKIQSLEKAIGEIEKSALSSALEDAKSKETLSASAYEKLKQEAMAAGSLSVQYEILRKIVEANSQLYIMLVQKSKQAELDHGIMGHNIVVNSPATLPLVPVSPNKPKILLIGAIMGLLGGIAAAFVLEQADRTLQTTDEIKKRLHLPILGAVPKISLLRNDISMDGDPGQYEFLAHRYPSSPFTDAVRIVQNTATSLLAGDASATVCISSALPLEGKTLLSVVMGTVIASEHKNVLIIDGDLRRPRIHSVFGASPDGLGLADLITGKCRELKDAVRQSQIPGLYYMTAGSPSENPVALLKTMRMHQILEGCKKVFDVVILDAPPLLGVVDARILSGYSDGLILVTRAGHTSVDVLRQAKEAAFQSQGRLLGIVLNMAERKSGGYDYYNSRYYYHRRREAPEQETNNRADTNSVA